MKDPFKRLICLVFPLLLICVLIACGKTSGNPEPEKGEEHEALESMPFEEEAAKAEAEQTVNIGTEEVAPDITELYLTGDYQLEALISASVQLSKVTSIYFEESNLSSSDLVSLQNAYPQANFYYSFDLLGHSVNQDTENLDLSDMDPYDSEYLISMLPLLTKLTSINFVSEEGACVFTLEDLDELDKLRNAAPNVRFHVSFDLFGQKVTSEDVEIRYVDVQIMNEGLELLYRVLPHLTDCTYLLLDECGIDYELLDEFRNSFPDVNIVWRIWLGSRYTVLTDVKKILASSDSEPKLEFGQAEPLKYCRDVVYLDLGHNRIPDISFVEYMPNLEVAVLAINYWSDLTPLLSCPKLEYLEIFSTMVRDISPLAEMTSLRHLNICNIRITDATPLYSMTFLERLWVGCTTSLPKEQLDELYTRLPDCEINTTTASPSAEGWRVHPRYELLREQMGYADYDYCYWWRDEKFS